MKKRFIGCFFLFFIALFSSASQSKAMSGSGTLADPYIISNFTDLQNVKNCLSCHYKLGADIDGAPTYITPNLFEPIGTPANPFTGSFDGNNKRISPLAIVRESQDYIGLFGYVDSPYFIKNLQISGFVKGRDYTSLVCGYCSTNIYSISAQATTIEGRNHVGSLSGSFQGNMDDIFNMVPNVIGNNFVGSLIGEFRSGFVSNTFSASGISLTGNDSAGGLIGIMRSASHLSNSLLLFSEDSSSPTQITSNSNAGAMVGKNEGATVSSSYYGTQYVNISASAGGTPKTMAELNNLSTYAGWDLTNKWRSSSEMDPSDNFPLPRVFWVSMGLPMAPLPQTPPNLHLVSKSHNSISIAWDSVADATRYIIFRNGNQVGSGTGLTFSDTGLSPNTSYTYSVVAENTNGQSTPAFLTVLTDSSRSWSISTDTASINLGTIIVDGATQISEGNLGTLSVNHTGSNIDGWKVAVSATPFTQSGGMGLQLPSNTLSIAAAPSINQTIGTGTLPMINGSSWFIDNGSVQLLGAAAGTGEGTFDISFPFNSLKLAIDTSDRIIDPSNHPTIYQSTITWTMSVGP